MRVRATQRGFHLQSREPGDVFEVPEKMFSKNWMEKLEDGGESKPPPPPPETPPELRNVPPPVGPTADGRPPKPPAKPKPDPRKGGVGPAAAQSK